VIHEMTQARGRPIRRQKGPQETRRGPAVSLSNQTGAGGQFLQAGAFINSREGLSMPDIQLHWSMRHEWPWKSRPRERRLTVPCLPSCVPKRGTICPRVRPIRSRIGHRPKLPPARKTPGDARGRQNVRDVCGQSALNALRGPRSCGSECRDPRPAPPPTENIERLHPPDRGDDLSPCRTVADGD